MTSPALLHRQKKLARLAKGTGPITRGAAPMPTEGPVASEYQLLLAQLGMDLNTLRNIESTDRKIAAKADMLDTYRPWLQGVLEGDGGAQDEIVVTMLIWSIDLAQWDLALALADYVLRHGLALPERFNRKPATLIAEEVAEAGLVKEPAISLGVLQAFARLVHDADIHDAPRAKLEKALGLAFKAAADAFDPEAENAVAGGKRALCAAALAHFHEALRLDDGAGVKKLIDGCERELKKLAPPPSE